MAQVRCISGVFFRDDKYLGMLAFSSRTGLIYAISHDRKTKFLEWLNGRKVQSKEFNQIARVGDNLNLIKFESPHLIPSIESFKLTTHCEAPIVINWMLTKECNLNCGYCFAKDIIESDEPEEATAIPRIAKTILSKNPIAVVLTGGDPLSSPFFADAIKQLSGKTGIIVDTNGIGLNKKSAETIRDAGGILRISIDSFNAHANNLIRRSRKVRVDAHHAAINAINLCKKYNIPCSVHTVLTKKSMATIKALGDTLFYMGIKSWRVFSVCPFGDDALWNELSPTDDNYNHYVPEILNRWKSHKGWGRSFSLQIVPSSRSDSVVLVSPSGHFMLQPTGKKHKIFIDDQHSANPSIAKLMSSIDVTGHIERYLNFS